MLGDLLNSNLSSTSGYNPGKPHSRPQSQSQQPQPHVQSLTSEEGRPPSCHCSFSNRSVLRSVKRECSVKGKKFWSCATIGTGSCKFFQWVVPGANGNGNGGSDRALDSGVCFKCRQSGHWAKNCPNVPGGGGGGEGGSQGSGGGGARGAARENAVCYRCQQPGHYSNECPNGPSGGGKWHK